MSLKHCIIHKIQRSQPGSQITSNIQENNLQAEDGIISLFEQLKITYRKNAQKRYGYFNSEESNNPMPAWIQDYYANRSSFLKITTNAVKQLVNLLDHTDDPFSAHLLFAIETGENRDHLYIFWIPHVDAYRINGALEVENTEYIDTSKLHFAAKLYVNEWQNGESNRYLSIYTNRGSKDLSNTFCKFCSFEIGVDVVEETNTFLNIVEQYAESLPPENVQEYKHKVIDYCINQNLQGNPVVIKQLSTELNEKEPEQFASYVQEQKQPLLPELRTDRNSLKRYVRFSGKDKKLSISFSSDIYGNQIHYNEHSGELTINKIPKSLKSQLARHRKED